MIELEVQDRYGYFYAYRSLKRAASIALRNEFAEGLLEEVERTAQYNEEAELIALSSGPWGLMTERAANRLGGTIPDLWESLDRWRVLEALRGTPDALYKYVDSHGCRFRDGRWYSNRWSSNRGGQQDVEPSCAYIVSMFQKEYLAGHQIVSDNYGIMYPGGPSQVKEFLLMLGALGALAAAIVYALFVILFVRVERRRESFLALSLIRQILNGYLETVREYFGWIRDEVVVLKASSLLHVFPEFILVMIFNVLALFMMFVMTVLCMVILLSAPLWATPAVFLEQEIRSAVQLMKRSDTLRLLLSYLSAIYRRVCPFIEWT